MLPFINSFVSRLKAKVVVVPLFDSKNIYFIKTLFSLLSVVTLAAARDYKASKLQECRWCRHVSSEVTILIFKETMRQSTLSSSFNLLPPSWTLKSTRVDNFPDLASNLMIMDCSWWLLNNNQNTMNMILCSRLFLSFLGNWIFSEVDWITSEIIVLNWWNCIELKRGENMWQTYETFLWWDLIFVE